MGKKKERKEGEDFSLGRDKVRPRATGANNLPDARNRAKKEGGEERRKRKVDAARERERDSIKMGNGEKRKEAKERERKSCTWQMN